MLPVKEGKHPHVVYFYFRDATDPCYSQFQIGPLHLSYPSEQLWFLLCGHGEEPWQSSSGMWVLVSHTFWNSPQWTSWLYKANPLLPPNFLESFNPFFNIKSISQPPLAHSQETVFWPRLQQSNKLLAAALIMWRFNTKPCSMDPSC